MITQRELAEYFRVEPEILGLVPQLLQDFDELGSDSGLVVEWLRAEGVAGIEKRVLDLGCGKGAVAHAVAGALGCRVDGVDALPAFVDEARRRAEERGLGDRCTFEVGDLRDTVTHARDYDAVLLVSVGVLGPPADMVAGCRGCVAPGGLIVLEDCYRRAPGSITLSGYENLPSREQALEQLASHGDLVVRERRTSLPEMRAQNHRFSCWIEARAAELERRHPEHADALRAYVAMERRECELLESVVECATWLLRRRA